MLRRTFLSLLSTSPLLFNLSSNNKDRLYPTRRPHRLEKIQHFSYSVQYELGRVFSGFGELVPYEYIENNQIILLNIDDKKYQAKNLNVSVDNDCEYINEYEIYVKDCIYNIMYSKIGNNIIVFLKDIRNKKFYKLEFLDCEQII